MPLAIATTNSQGQTTGADKPEREVGELVTRIYPDLQTIYEDIHSHPELGFEEVRTSARLAADMRSLPLPCSIRSVMCPLSMSPT